MKIILKTFINTKQEREYWIVTVEKGNNKAKQITKELYEAIKTINQTACN